MATPTGSRGRFRLVVLLLLAITCIGAVLLSDPRAGKLELRGTAQQPRDGSQIPALPVFAAASALDVEGLPPFLGGTYTPPIQKRLSCGAPPCVLPNVSVSTGPKAANETPVVVDPNNPQQLLAAANDWNCGLAGDGIYTSNDGGNTWARTCMDVLSGLVNAGDPGVAYDLQGNAYATELQGKYSGGLLVAFEKSSDNGKTWSAPQIAVPPLFGGGNTDKDWLQIDTSAQSPYVNTLYISVGQYDASGHFSIISVSHSNDGGQTWTMVHVGKLVALPEVVDSSALTIGTDGTLYLTWMQCTTNQQTQTCGGSTASFEFATSTDGGTTWTTPQTILRAQQPLAPCRNFRLGGDLPNTCARVVDIPVIAVDNGNGPHKGNLYVAYFDWTGTFMKVYVATSTDHGSTWTKKAVAPAGVTHDQFFPWVNVSESGIVGVSWLDRRNDPKNANYEAFAAFSKDGGQSFGKNIDLSSKPSNPCNDGFGCTFLGDYTGNAWVGNKTFYVTYTDTTTGIDQDFLGGYQLK
jgi:hypothetical protein